MPEKSYSFYQRETRNSCRISVEELLNFLKDQNFNNITARSGGYRFFDIDDIERSKALFAGFPDIEADGISIVLGEYRTSVSVGSGQEGQHAAVDGIFNFLNLHISFADKYFVALCVSIIISAVLFITYIPPMLGYDLELSPLGRAAVGGFTALAVTTLFVLFLKPRIKAVYYNPRKTFWERHSEAIISAIVTAIISGLLGFALSGFLM